MQTPETVMELCGGVLPKQHVHTMALMLIEAKMDTRGNLTIFYLKGGNFGWL